MAKHTHTPGPWEVIVSGTPPYERVGKFWPQPGAHECVADCSHAALASAAALTALRLGMGGL